MAFLNVKNRASSTLAADITSTATSLSVATGDGTKFPAAPFHITIENEILEVTAVSGDTFTVTRAQEGTTAAAHTAGKAVELRITAKIIDDLRIGIQDIAINVKTDYGAKGDETTDDTTAIQNAINDGVNNNKPVYFPPGHYKITAALTIAAGKHPFLIGAGTYITQIIQFTANTDLFSIGTAGTNTNSYYIGHMTLGTVSGTGNALKLIQCHRGLIENIDVTAVGNYAIFISGCILNTFKTIKLGVNLYSSFAGTTYGSGFYLERNATGAISCNANTFIDCIAEGGDYGWYIADQASQGNNYIFGGVAEGNATRPIYAVGCQNMHIAGFHIEADYAIYLSSCQNTVIENVRGDGVELSACENVIINGGYHKDITISADSSFCVAKNFKYTNQPLNLSPTSEILDAIDESGAASKDVGISRMRKLITTNGDLEAWTSGVPNGFSNYNAATLTKTGTGQTDTTKYSRDYACKVEKSEANSYKGLSFDIPAKYQKCWVSVEAWIKCNVTDQQVQIMAFLNGGAAVSTLACKYSSSWQKFQGRFYFDPTYTSMLILFCSPFNVASGSFYIDKIVITVDYDDGS